MKGKQYAFFYLFTKIDEFSRPFTNIIRKEKLDYV